MKKYYVILSVLALCFVLVSGIWIGMRLYRNQMLEISEAKEKYGTDVAVVNQDLGVTVEDETVNYANAVIETLGDDYVVVSSSAAQTGLENGTYGAVVTFPADFSENILSINQSNPEIAVLDIDVSKKLPEEKYITLYTQLIGMQQQVNNNMAYAYVESVFDELHFAQDDVDELLANDVTDMNAVEKVRLAKYIEMLDLGDIPKVEFNPESPDFDALLAKVQTIAEDMNKVYVDSYAKAQTDFTDVKQQISDYETTITNQSAQWTADMNAWSSGVVTYVGNVSGYRQYLIRWRNDADEYRTKEANYAKAVENYKTAVDTYLSKKSDNLKGSLAELETWRTDANSTISGIANGASTAENDINTKITNCSNVISSYNSEIDKLVEWNEYIEDYQKFIQDPSTYDEPEKPEVAMPKKLDATNALNELSSFSKYINTTFAGFKTMVKKIPAAPSVYAIAPFTGTLTETQPDFIEELKDAPGYSQPAELPSQPQELTDALTGIVSVSAGYNPNDYLNDETKEEAEKSVSEYDSHLKNEKSEMESKNANNLQKLNSAYQTYNSHVGDLRMNITEVHTKEQENLAKNIAELCKVLKHTSTLNHGLMDSFVSRMPNSRTETSVNEKVVEATVTPVTGSYNYIQGDSGKHRIGTIPWLLPLLILIAIAMIVVTVRLRVHKARTRSNV